MTARHMDRDRWASSLAAWVELFGRLRTGAFGVAGKLASADTSDSELLDEALLIKEVRTFELP